MSFFIVSYKNIVINEVKITIFEYLSEKKLHGISIKCVSPPGFGYRKCIKYEYMN